MGKHDHMSSRQIRATIEQRLSRGENVGQLINTLQSRGEGTSGYGSRRSTQDLAAHVRWNSYQAKASPEETRELQRRTALNTKSSGEHDGMTTDQLHATVKGRLARGEAVGRLVEELRRRGEKTAQYQEQRTNGDLASHLKWGSSGEEIVETERRREIADEKAHGLTPWWKFW